MTISPSRPQLLTCDFKLRSYSLISPPSTGRRLIRSWSVTVRGGVRVIVARRDTFQCSVRPAAAVVGAVLAENGPQVSFTEDQDAVGEFGSDGQDVAFDEAVRSRTSRPNLHGLYACVGRDCVERGGELARSVADEDPEDRCGRRSPSGGCGLVGWSRRRLGGWSLRGCARSGCGLRGRRTRRSASASQRSRRGRSLRPACWMPALVGTGARTCRSLGVVPVVSAAA